MRLFLKKKKNILLFFCGLMIGICLEMIFIESGKIPQILFRDFIGESVNITCLILLNHQHMRYVTSSKKTWLKHCSNYKIVYVQRPKKLESKISNISNSPFGTEKFHGFIKKYTICPKREDVQKILANNAWAGLCKALHFIKPNRFHWLVIVPDNLLVLVENLRLFVKKLNYDEGHYFGYPLKNYEADYNVLSAGILLSRGAVKKLLDRFSAEEDCDLSGKYWKNEDRYLGKYLKQMEILPKDTRDEDGRGRFHGYNMNNILWPGKLFMLSDYKKKSLYPVSQGFKCCSPFMITVDVSDPDSMHNLYFLLYKIKTNHKKLPKKAKLKKTEGTYWKHFLREEGYNETEIENMTNEEYYKIWEKKLPQDKMYQEIHDFLRKNKNQFN